MKKLALPLAIFFVWTGLTRADTSYLRTLVDQPATTFADGVYMVVNFLGRGADFTDFEAQKGFLRDQEILGGKLADKGSNEILRKGELAEISLKTLGFGEASFSDSPMACFAMEVFWGRLFIVGTCCGRRSF